MELELVKPTRTWTWLGKINKKNCGKAGTIRAVFETSLPNGEHDKTMVVIGLSMGINHCEELDAD